MAHLISSGMGQPTIVLWGCIKTSHQGKEETRDIRSQFWKEQGGDCYGEEEPGHPPWLGSDISWAVEARQSKIEV